MFRLIEPSSGQNTKRSTGTFSECTHYMLFLSFFHSLMLFSFFVSISESFYVPEV